MAGPLNKQTDNPVHIDPPLENRADLRLRGPAQNGARPEDTIPQETLLEDRRDCH